MARQEKKKERRRRRRRGKEEKRKKKRRQEEEEEEEKEEEEEEDEEEICYVCRVKVRNLRSVNAEPRANSYANLQKTNQSKEFQFVKNEPKFSL